MFSFNALFHWLYSAIFLQIQIWSTRTCIRRQATMDRLLLLLLLLLRVLPILVHHTPTTNPHPRRVIRSDLTAQYFDQFIDSICKNKFSFDRTWSRRPSQCPPCPRLFLLMAWATWATNHTTCRIWFQHCQDKTLICPPNSPTCQPSSPYTNRSVCLFVIVLFKPH